MLSSQTISVHFNLTQIDMLVTGHVRENLAMSHAIQHGITFFLQVIIYIVSTILTIFVFKFFWLDKLCAGLGLLVKWYKTSYAILKPFLFLQ